MLPKQSTYKCFNQSLKKVFNMKKNLIAVAVATAFAAPAVMADATLYGLANMSIGTSSSDATGTKEDNAIRSTASRFGIKGSNDLGNGLKAVYQAEFQIDMASNDLSISSRNQFAGLAGGFGTIMLGKLDTPYKSAIGKVDMFADTLGDMSTKTVAVNTNTAGATTAESDKLASIQGEVRAANSLTYVSPKFEGVQLSVQTSDHDGSDAAAEQNMTSVSVSYTGVKGLMVAYSMDTDATDGKGTGAAKDDRSALSATYAIDNMKFGLIYETVDASDELTTVLVNGSYKMDEMTFKAQYATAMTDSGNGVDGDSNLSLGVDYGFNKTTKAYFVYNDRKDESTSSNDVTSYQVGILTKF
jgi:predicted porin